MKKVFLAVIVSLIALCSNAQTADNFAPKCEGGKCAANCFFGSCSVCCPKGSVAECDCWLELVDKCKCNINALADSKIVSINDANLAAAINYLKSSKSSFYQIFVDFSDALKLIAVTKPEGGKYFVNPQKYDDIVVKVEEGAKPYTGSKEFADFLSWVKLNLIK